MGTRKMWGEGYSSSEAEKNTQNFGGETLRCFDHILTLVRTIVCHFSIHLLSTEVTTYLLYAIATYQMIIYDSAFIQFAKDKSISMPTPCRMFYQIIGPTIVDFLIRIYEVSSFQKKCGKNLHAMIHITPYKMELCVRAFDGRLHFCRNCITTTNNNSSSNDTAHFTTTEIFVCRRFLLLYSSPSP